MDFQMLVFLVALLPGWLTGLVALTMFAAVGGLTFLFLRHTKIGVAVVLLFGFYAVAWHFLAVDTSRWKTLGLIVYLGAGTIAAVALFGAWMTAGHWPRTFAALVALLLMASATTWYVKDRRAGLRALPAQALDGALVYRQEDSAGSAFFPGPHDRAAGVIVYALSERDVVAIEKIINEPEKTNHPRGLLIRGKDDQLLELTHWQPTPLAAGEWLRDENAQGTDLQSFFRQNGFALVVEPTVEAMVNRVIATPGSWICRTGSNAVIFSPRERRFILVYAGY